MQRLWLLFAQTITVGLAVWFLVLVLKPEWAGSMGEHLRQAQSASSLNVQESNSTPGIGSYREAAKRAMPSVVNIFTTKEAKRPNNPFMEDPLYRKFFGDGSGGEQDEKQFSLGSGVIISADGFVLTNNHVVEAADEIEVALADGRKSAAKVVGTDPDTDLAVVKIDLRNLPAITLGHAEQAKVGDVVLAIGDPFDIGQTVTMGIISALGRNGLGINNIEDFIQTDAAINPGNSGGALVDTNGNLLGINTAIYSRTGGSLGIGFAIPVTTAKSVMEAIISKGQVVRGYIGVESQDITPELAESFGLNTKTGVIIAGVVKGGPADKAGIKPGDILVAVEGKQVSDITDMLNLISQLTPGDTAKLTLLHKSRQSEIKVTVGRRPKIQRTEDSDER